MNVNDMIHDKHADTPVFLTMINNNVLFSERYSTI